MSAIALIHNLTVTRPAPTATWPPEIAKRLAATVTRPENHVFDQSNILYIHMNDQDNLVYNYTELYESDCNEDVFQLVLQMPEGMKLL